MTIDDIYDLFIWDPALTLEENAARAEKGMAAARKLKNLYPFLQPIIVSPRGSKSAWDPCARLIAERTDEELEPHLFKLLEWIQDMNWPGADTIFERLRAMPYERIESYIRHCKRIAAQTDDEIWIENLNALK